MGVVEGHGGIELHYKSTGIGRPVVFLPGLGLDASIWLDVTAIIAQYRRAVVLDNRGSGLSDVPRGDYTVELLGRDLFNAVRNLELKRPLIVGHSLGGFIAMDYVLNHPDALRGLVLVSSSDVGSLKRIGTSPDVIRVLTRFGGPKEEVIRDNLTVCVAEGFDRREPERFGAILAHQLKHPPRGRGIRGQWAAAVAFDITEHLPQITCPTLIVHGTGDRLMPVQRSATLADRIFNSKLELLNDVGHLPQIEAPDDLTASILQFDSELED